MTKYEKIDELEVGFDVPAHIGMAYEDIQTPCLILDLDALDRNVKKICLLYTSPSPRDISGSRMPSSA